LDTEWLLSTLFDASLLSTSKAAGNGGSFFCVFPPHLQRKSEVPATFTQALGRALETINALAAGLFAPARAMICSS
jgi:hypothetical protein